MYRWLFLYFSVVHAELEMVQVLVRHGDRAPSFTYPLDDSFKVSEHFPRGYSQLTRRGFAQARDLGTYLRERYGSFVTKYDREELLIRSSDKDRCIETAMGITQTLFPDDIVPIHTYSHYKQDLLLKPNSVFCRRVDEIVKSDKKKLVDAIDKEYRSLFNFLSLKTGWIVNGSNVADVFNVLHRKNENGVPQPEWVQTVLSNVTELKRRLRTAEFNSDEKSKLRTGYLLGQISKDINSRARGASKKFFVYATHDATLTSLMYSLGVADHELVPYTAALILETHKVDGRHYVKILYRDSSVILPKNKHIPGCDTLCPLEHYNKFVSTRIFNSREEFESACQNNELILEPTSSHKISPEDPILFPEENIFSTVITFASLAFYDLFSFLNMKH